MVAYKREYRVICVKLIFRVPHYMHIVYKNKGETPLQCVERLFDTSLNVYTYAGRLDPMACGLVLVLEGSECKSAKTFHSLPKEYTYSFVLGVSTDSYDMLGCVTKTSFKTPPTEKEVRGTINSMVGTFSLPYPAYSSKTVNGTPLFMYARSGRLSEIDIPVRDMVVNEHTVVDITKVSINELRESAVSLINLVNGDFRQEECRNSWNKIENNVSVIEVTVTVSVESGTYIRSIVHQLGQILSYPTVTTKLERTKIGDWSKPTKL